MVTIESIIIIVNPLELIARKTVPLRQQNRLSKNDKRSPTVQVRLPTGCVSFGRFLRYVYYTDYTKLHIFHRK